MTHLTYGLELNLTIKITKVIGIEKLAWLLAWKKKKSLPYLSCICYLCINSLLISTQARKYKTLAGGFIWPFSPPCPVLVANLRSPGLLRSILRSPGLLRSILRSPGPLTSILRSFLRSPGLLRSILRSPGPLRSILRSFLRSPGPLRSILRSPGPLRSILRSPGPLRSSPGGSGFLGVNPRLGGA